MKIDYIIAWVDGADPVHQAQKELYKNSGNAAHIEAIKSERFTNNGEIYYHIASIIKYAPFINHLYIITDNQSPIYLDGFHLEGKCAADFISIVSHESIFVDLPALLPNYNSLAIESAMWRIPELSENFIYGNDDFFINGPVTVNDFFDDKLPVLHGTWTSNGDLSFKYKIRSLFRKFSTTMVEEPKFLTSLWKGAKIAGFNDQYLKIHHHPHPLRKSTFQEFFQQNPNLLDEQVQYRFRSAKQFNPISLINHIEISNHNLKPKAASDLAYIDVVKPKRLDREIVKLQDENVSWGCVQGMELLPSDLQRKIHKKLIKKFYDYLPHDFIASQDKD